MKFTKNGVASGYKKREGFKMIRVGDYIIRRYESGWELLSPYDGYEKSGDLKLKKLKHRSTYWPNLNCACMGLLDRLCGESDSESVEEMIIHIDEAAKMIETAIGRINTA
jgi:hypothetical protein